MTVTITGVMDVAPFFILPAAALIAGLAAFFIRPLTWGRYLGAGAAVCVLVPAVVFLLALSGVFAPEGRGPGSGPDLLDLWVLSLANSFMASGVLLVMSLLLAAAAVLRARTGRRVPRRRKAPAG